MYKMNTRTFLFLGKNKRKNTMDFSNTAPHRLTPIIILELILELSKSYTACTVYDYYCNPIPLYS